MSKLKEFVKSETPEYKIHLPLSNKNITYRPFRVKEEKILLLALEEGTQEAMLIAIKNIVNSCCNITDGGSLPMTDLEYLFVNIRAKSVGEVCEPQIKCPYTGKNSKAKVNISDIPAPDVSSVGDSRIKLTDTLGITLKYPCIDSLLEIDFDESETDQLIGVIASCLDEVWTEEKVMNCNDVEIEERVNFVESLTSEEFQVLGKFIQSIPKLTHKVKYFVIDEEKQKKEEYEITLSGLNDFFT